MKEVRYFYVPDAPDVNELPQDEAIHALRVLRLQTGDDIYIMNGRGTFYHAEVTLATNKRCLFAIKTQEPQTPTWHGHIHLAMAPTKMMERVEWMAEKCTEIGFNELSLLDCKFSERHKVRTDRLEKIIVSAVKQSRKAWMPVVNEMVMFKDFVSKERSGRKFICHCYDEVEKTDFWEEISNTNTESEDITVLIGPEGDFSIDEVRLAIANGYESVTLGRSRLRTETAALEAVAMSNLARRI